MHRRTSAIVAVTLAAAWLLGAAGCGSDSDAVIQSATPLPGSTAVGIDTVVRVQIHSDAELDVGLLSQKNSRAIVLYDVTGGGRSAVGGTINAGSSGFTYEPTSPLRAGRSYALEIKREAILGDGFNETDGTLWPEETITWPYRLAFSTASAPRVSGAYLHESDGEQRLVVYFSQAMDLVASGPSAAVLDGVTRGPVKLRTPVWANDRHLELQPTVPLDRASLYILKVDTTATAKDNTRLDGNANGKPGESGDSFCVQFTGSQRLVFSRLGATTPSKCP